jgi:serine/threonine-protein kinase RsbW
VVGIIRGRRDGNDVAGGGRGDVGRDALNGRNRDGGGLAMKDETFVGGDADGLHDPAIGIHEAEDPDGKTRLVAGVKEIVHPLEGDSHPERFLVRDGECAGRIEIEPLEIHNDVRADAAILADGGVFGGDLAVCHFQLADAAACGLVIEEDSPDRGLWSAVAALDLDDVIQDGFAALGAQSAQGLVGRIIGIATRDGEETEEEKGAPFHWQDYRIEGGALPEFFSSSLAVAAVHCYRQSLLRSPGGGTRRGGGPRRPRIGRNHTCLLLKKRKIEFASHPGNLSLVRNFVREFLAECAFVENEVNLIVLGLDEACSNVIRHAYNHEETLLITLSCEKTGSGVRFRLRDFGAGTDPARMKGRQLERVRPGGLGLHLIREAFDQVEYNLKKRGTELVLTRAWEQ